MVERISSVLERSQSRHDIESCELIVQQKRPDISVGALCLSSSPCYWTSMLPLSVAPSGNVGMKKPAPVCASCNIPAAPVVTALALPLPNLTVSLPNASCVTTIELVEPLTFVAAPTPGKFIT